MKTTKERQEVKGIQVQLHGLKPKKTINMRKVAFLSVVLVFTLSFLFFAALPPIIMKDMINMHVNFKNVYEPEAAGIAAEKLTLKTEDGLNIIAYEAYEENPKGVVIFLSGIHNPSVTAFFHHGRMLKENGYASMFLEMRAHGESEGDMICLGYKEYMDTKAAVDYIKAQDKYTDVPIVVFGVSMGGATAINSIGKIQEIDGLISLSAYSSWEDIFADNMENMGIPKVITKIQKPFLKAYTIIKYGWDRRSVNPKKQIQNLGTRPALIIHSKQDSQVPLANFNRLMEHAPAHVETWIRDGDLHFIVQDDYFENPVGDTEYANRILGFLNRHFGEK